MKKQRKVEKDNRGVAIYARKSRITNKGDSIGVQFKQCADYAKKELGLDEEYEFLQYEDKGLSGYFSDRPDFQRMLHDVQNGKIKAIVCYKLDRVGRKTADLIRLMDFLEMYHEQFGELKYKYRNREFWCRGYYVDTVGKNTSRIAEYIQNQLKEDELGEQLTMSQVGPFTGSK